MIVSTPQRFPTKLIIPFPDTQATATTVISDLDELIRTTPTQGSVLPTDNSPRLFSNLNNMQYHDYGDDTNIDRTWSWIPEVTGNIDKIYIHIGFLMNMTARSSDDATFTTASITINPVC